MTDPEPWERFPTETARAYQAFRAYRDLGPSRRLVDVPAKLGAAREWSLRHRWVERARAWDMECYRIEDSRRLEAIRLMDEQHGRAARVLLQTGLRALQDMGPLTPHQAARFVDLGARLERIAAGERMPTPVVEPVEEERHEELSPLERIARELTGIA